MARDVLLMRTRSVDEHVAGIAARYASAGGVDCAAIVDGSRPQGRSGLHTILRVESVRQFGLYFPIDAAWRCGDYGLYLARTHFPEAQYFWLFEEDVRIRFSDPARFFSLFERADDDFLSTYFRETDGTWAWHRSMSRFHHRIYKCFFPVIRISAPAIDFLLHKRLAMSAQHEGIEIWPNDESFAATELANAGFTCRNLWNIRADVTAPESFGYWFPHSEKRILAEAPDDKLYHPVLGGAAYGAKARKFLERFPAEAEKLLPGMSAEFGEGAARRFAESGHIPSD